MVDTRQRFFPDTARAAIVFFISGLVGFSLGCFYLGSWQVAVEGGQVVSGLVPYPTDNPNYLYLTKIITITHQLTAVLLKCGLSEISISLLLSGIIGMVSFQALALITFAFSDSILIALLCPFFMISTHIYWGVGYPIMLMGSHHTYGALGLSFTLLVIGLFATGMQRTAQFSLALAPVVHPSWGLALWIAAAMAWVSGRRKFKLPNFQDSKFFLLGGLCAGASLLYHFAFTYQGVDIDHDPEQLMTAFNFWDGHRQQISYVNAGVLANVYVVCLSLLWCTVFRREHTEETLSTLRIFFFFGLLGLAGVALSHISIEHMPPWLNMLMPTRANNLNSLGFGCLLIGLMARAANGIHGKIILVTLLTIQLIIVYPFDRFLTISLVFFVFAIVHSLSFASQLPKSSQAAQPDRPGFIFRDFIDPLRAGWLWLRGSVPNGKNVRLGLDLMIFGLMSCFLAIAVLAGDSLSWEKTQQRFADRTSDPFLATVGSEEGLLLTCSDLTLIQLVTRRPVLLDGGGLDMLPYTPEAGPAVSHILREIYGVDLFDPPPEARGSGQLPSHIDQALWQRRSLVEWQQIRREFGVTSILTYKDYDLDLPLTAENKEYRLFEIP